MEYELIFDKEFQKNYRKIDKSLQIQGDKKILKLKENPYAIGKPLGIFNGLRELYLGSYRIYYFIQNNQIKVLLLDILHKNEQQKYLNQLTLEKIKQLSENL